MGGTVLAPRPLMIHMRHHLGALITAALLGTSACSGGVVSTPSNSSLGTPGGVGSDVVWCDYVTVEFSEPAPIEGLEIEVSTSLGDTFAVSDLDPWTTDPDVRMYELQVDYDENRAHALVSDAAISTIFRIRPSPSTLPFAWMQRRSAWQRSSPSMPAWT